MCRLAMYTTGKPACLEYRQTVKLSWLATSYEWHFVWYSVWVQIAVRFRLIVSFKLRVSNGVLGWYMCLGKQQVEIACLQACTQAFPNKNKITIHTWEDHTVPKSNKWLGAAVTIEIHVFQYLTGYVNSQHVVQNQCTSTCIRLWQFCHDMRALKTALSRYGPPMFTTPGKNNCKQSYFRRKYGWQR